MSNEPAAAIFPVVDYWVCWDPADDEYADPVTTEYVVLTAAADLPYPSTFFRSPQQLVIKE